MDKIRIGTRGSKLALWQAHRVAELLANDGYDSDIITIDTKGDKILDVSISKIGSKGVFTEEIEEQLKLGNIDIAVHSAKDMQSELPEGFELIAFTQREKVNDVVVSLKPAISLNDPLTIGTSSTRRVAILKHFYPHIKTVAVRGNLQTRIKKMQDGACDALLLAYAGVHRMGYHAMILKTLSLDEFIPAVGQGSIAVEASADLEGTKREAIRNCVNHQPTEMRLLCERAYLRVLQGGCSIPVFGLAKLDESHIKIKAGIISLDGKELIVKELEGPAEEAEELGKKIAEKVLSSGGSKILKEIKKQITR